MSGIDKRAWDLSNYISARMSELDGEQIDGVRFFALVEGAIRKTLAAAVETERAQCAEVAEMAIGLASTDTYDDACRYILATIRKRGGGK